MALVDVNGNLMNNVDSGSIIISAVDAGAHVLGSNTAALVGGKATFKSTIFKSSPGKENVRFKLTATEINYHVVQHLDPVKYADQLFTVNFRW